MAEAKQDADTWRELTILLDVDTWSRESLEEVLRKHRSEKHQDYQQLVRVYKELCDKKECSANTEKEDSRISNLLIKLQQVSTLITENHISLVTAIFRCDWSIQSGDVFEEYKLFVFSLLTTTPFFIDACLKNLVQKFRVLPSSLTLNLDVRSFRNLDLKIVSYYERIHSVIQRVVDIVPLSRPKLLRCITEGYPFRLRSGEEHFLYTYNVLQLIERDSSGRSALLSSLLEYTVKMDADASPTELNDLVVEDSDQEEESENSDVASWRTEYPTAERLDLVLTLIFEHIESLGANHASGSCRLRQFYSDTLAGFEGYVFKCHGLTHVQFLWFYMAGLQERIGSDFLQRLWRKTLTTNTPPMFRQYAACYVSSYIARAKFVPVRLMVKFVDEIVIWILTYIKEYDNVTMIPDWERTHRVFYAICQNVFYVITFRHREIFSQQKGLLWFKSLNFQRIIMCNLNPLKYCQKIVRNQFAAVTAQFNLLFCYSVIERNERMAIFAGPKDDNDERESNPLNTFFPFEPYVLKRSRRFIVPYYRTYDEPVGDDNVDEFEKYRGLIADSEDSNNSSDGGDIVDDKFQNFPRTSRKRQLSENSI